MNAQAQQKCPEKITTAVVLAGGFGKRLQNVAPGVPKPMALILGRPFLDYLIEYLFGQGISKVVLAVGYLGEQIKEYFGKTRHGLDILCLQETRPLGTGGALAFAAKELAQGSYFLALNGDSFAPFALDLMRKELAAGADAAITAVAVTDTGRFGSLALDALGRLTGFNEKKSSADSLINAGIYLLPASWFPREKTPEPCSVEKDCFPRWLAEGKKIAVVNSPGPFIDIGTPETFAQAPMFIRQCVFFNKSEHGACCDV